MALHEKLLTNVITANIPIPITQNAPEEDFYIKVIFRKREKSKCFSQNTRFRLLLSTWHCVLTHVLRCEASNITSEHLEMHKFMRDEKYLRRQSWRREA